VDFSKENKLWYYLGKPSTEAKSQYTEDLAKPRNNPKSNFLDTVKPPPIPIPTFQRQSYPASYPLKPAPPGAAPRTMMPQQIAPAGGRPYQYKPKDALVTSWKSPMHNPGTRQNPNSPVAHQPNVTYDHRSNTQYGYPPPRPLPQQYQQQQYHPYAPPQHNYSAQGYAAQAVSSGPLLDGIDKYAHTNQSQQALPPYPYSQGNAQSQLSYSGTSAAPYGSPAQQDQTPPPQGRAPISNLLSTPTGTSKPPMYAVTPHSSVVYAAQTPTEYLAYVMKYPYLKNAYLRRQKTYISPYSPGGGIAPEWVPKPPPVASGATPTPSTRTESAGSHGYYPSPSPSSIAPRPAAQFQSPDAFQRGLTQASTSATGAPKWEQMLKQLATSAGPTTSSPATASPQYPPLPRSSTSYGMPNAPGPFQKHTPPLPPPAEPQRPIPSPISDDGKGGVVAAKSVLPPPPATQPQAGQVHSGETWRFS